MIHTIETTNVASAYVKVLELIRQQAAIEASRNGDVLTLEDPLALTIRKPWQRVLYDPVRQANPYFHVMEFIWMMSGSDRVEWIEQFNSGFRGYAESSGRLHGAYGHRWRKAFGLDQIIQAVEMLRVDPGNRRVLLGMWHPSMDLGIAANDLPCNTHIYLRIVNGNLDFTVCNRSNDVIWGMLGANIVHMTMLQQLLAEAIGVPMGLYRVFTVNAHVYTAVPNFDKIMATTERQFEYTQLPLTPTPLLEGTTLEGFLEDCEAFVGGQDVPATHWLENTAAHMYVSYDFRKDKDYERSWGCLQKIQSPDWKLACEKWEKWKDDSRN